jgi:VWFA-related protein
MKRPIEPFLALALSIGSLCLPGLASEGVDPLEIHKQEQVDVRLVLIDTVVIDRQGRTVSDLTIDEFVVTVDGRRRPIDTLDVRCPIGDAPDATAVGNPKQRPRPPEVVERDIVLAFDYLHMIQLRRPEVLDHAREMVEHGMAPGDRIMIAVLNGGLRIEQVFTDEPDRALAALDQMEYDISLWQPDFTHTTEDSFFTGLRALFTVLEAVPGSKSMVLFSDHPGRSDENDIEFARLAAAASMSRCSIYPVQAQGLFAVPPG